MNQILFNLLVLVLISYFTLCWASKKLLRLFSIKTFTSTVSNVLRHSICWATKKIVKKDNGYWNYLCNHYTKCFKSSIPILWLHIFCCLSCCSSRLSSLELIHSQAMCNLHQKNGYFRHLVLQFLPEGTSLVCQCYHFHHHHHHFILHLMSLCSWRC